MSRIGNKPIEIPEKVEINIDGNKINVKGPKGELVTEVLEEKIKFEISDNVLQFTRESDEKQVKSLHGLYRSLVANNIVGVSEGYSKTLTLQGVGHRVTLKGNDLEILCGFSHPVIFKKVENIKQVKAVKQEINTKIFTKEIFFTPEVHRIINSLSLRCFKTKMDKDIRKERGINLTEMPSRLSKEYLK